MGWCSIPRRRRATVIASVGLLALALGPIWAGFPPLVATARAGTPATSSRSRDDSDLQDLADLQARFKAVAARVSPAVVAISASTTTELSPAAGRSEELNGDRLNAFLAKTTRMVGTGFVISSDGYILTNDHVINDAQHLWVTTDDKRVFPALVIGSDPRADLAVLKIPTKDLPAVHFGDGTRVTRGQWSIAIGNPFGLSADGEMCISVGVVSAVGRSLPKLSDRENRLYCNLIQSTAQINPGNSGGPLFDLNGEVIGINTAVIMPQKSLNGVGFAMPIDARLLFIVDELKQGREIVYGYLGVVVGAPTERDRRLAKLDRPIGARVDSIQADSPAIGLFHENDLIVSIDGQVITNSDCFVQSVGNAPVTRAVAIDFIRDEKPITVSVTLGKRQMPVAAVTRENQRLRWGGMVLGAAPVITGAKPAGLMVYGIEPASPFTKLGVREGTVIHTVAGKPVTAVTDMQGIINDTPIEQCDLGFAANLATAVVPVSD